MGLTIAQKIIKSHLISGEMTAGEEISIAIDYTLTQDSTGTMAYLQFEAMGVSRVKTKKSLAYIDHNTLQTGPENADDHRYIASVAKKHGIYFSRPGNGICHQVNLERFGVPGATLLGSDSHTPTGGGIGMLSIGAGGLDIAVAMGGGAYFLKMPKMVKIELTGKLRAGVSAKDIILEVLRRMSVKGGVGKIIEYGGDGIVNLTVPDRATIANMGAELGATTSVFPSDEVTEAFLTAQNRKADFTPLCSDGDAVYDEILCINLGTLEPMVALPHSPDNVKTVREVGAIAVDQVCIGSCTNGSYRDMMATAAILGGNFIAENTDVCVAPGSKQVLSMIAGNGALSEIIGSGVRILECACGPCIGMGQSPKTDAVSLRTNNRNFFGRSGTKSAGIYIVSPETAAASAITGVLTSPLCLGEDTLSKLDIKIPEKFDCDDNLIVAPAEIGEEIEIVRGPNIKPFPINTALPDKLSGGVLLKMGDNITTDHIMPSNAKLLPYRSNIPYLSDFCLTPVDETFPARAKENGGGFLVGGENYGQGSSREHAALVPLYLGIKAVVAKSFARIHAANLINSGILPLTFADSNDYDTVNQGDELVIENVVGNNGCRSDGSDQNTNTISLKNITNGKTISVVLEASERQRKILLAGGLLNFTKNGQ